MHANAGTGINFDNVVFAVSANVCSDNIYAGDTELAAFCRGLSEVFKLCGCDVGAVNSFAATAKVAGL